MKNKNKILVAATVGATIGGILGILFAPDKGKNTRNKIKETSSKFSESIKDRVNGSKDKLSKLREDMKSRLEVDHQNIESLL